MNMTKLETIDYIKKYNLPIKHIYKYGEDESWIDLYGYRLIVFYPLKIENPINANSYKFELTWDCGVMPDNVLETLCIEHNLDFARMKEIIEIFLQDAQNSIKKVCNEHLVKEAWYGQNKENTCSYSNN